MGLPTWPMAWAAVPIASGHSTSLRTRALAPSGPWRWCWRCWPSSACWRCCGPTACWLPWPRWWGRMCCRVSGRCSSCAAGRIFVVFYAASACLSSAISYLFYSVCTLQRPCRRLDGPLVRAQAAGFYRRLPGCHAAGQRNRLLPGRGAGLALDVTGAPPKTRLWLVRHAQPLVAPGTCYGALDIPADPAATRAAAEHLAAALPPQSRVIHSTLQRCEQLAL